MRFPDRNYTRQDSVCKSRSIYAVIPFAHFLYVNLHNNEVEQQSEPKGSKMLFHLCMKTAKGLEREIPGLSW